MDEQTNITFFKSYFEAVEDLSPEEQGTFFMAIYNYVFNGIEPGLSGAIKCVFIAIKPNLDATMKRNKSNRDNGSKGGRPPRKTEEKTQEVNSVTEPETQEQTSVMEEKTQVPCSVIEFKTPTSISVSLEKEKEKDIGVGIGIGKEKEGDGSKRKRFSPPSVQEVSDFCKKRRNNVDAEQFVAFYESKGWKVGSQPMKSWTAAVVTWEKRYHKEVCDEEPCEYVIPEFKATC